MTDMTPGELIARMTDAEKVSLTAGEDAWTTTAIARLGIPSIRLGDGPHGVRKPHAGSGMSMFDSHPATCFPTAALLGSTWDPALMRLVGEALGREAAGHEVAVLLGPGVNLKRTPIGGRNFEYFSEDPHLSSRMGAAWVAGVQSTGVGASLKHFAANNTEQRRYGIDAVVDERALRELYLASFEHIVVEERPATVMAAYNKLNGEHCSENPWLLGTVLRGEWGFDGVVLSDWGAVWDRTLSIPAGADLAMPGVGRSDDRYVRDAVRSGVLGRADLEESVRRILSLIERYGRTPNGTGGVDLDGHHQLARRAAAAGTVLLKNDGLLPLDPSSRIAVIGAFASEPRFQGAGSSHVVATRVDTLLEALGESAADVTFSEGYDRASSASSAEQVAEAVTAAEAADVAIVVVGLPETFETEGVDRSHLRLPPAHDRLVEAVRKANARTVVVLQNGSPVELPWRHDVPAIVEGYLGGQAGGSALADVLLGVSEPGGRLAETFPEQYTDHPVSHLPLGRAALEYRESLYLGYRWFDSAHEDVAFPFGHGLSYTTFEWADAAVEAVGDDTVEVCLVVENTGDRAGSEVVQVYVHDVDSSVFRPEQELRGFAKVELDAGEKREVVIRLGARAFQFWSPAESAWVLEPGRFELRLGRSSRDILWHSTVQLGRPDAAVPHVADEGVYRAPRRASGFPAADFERLLGRALPTNTTAQPGRFTLDTAIRDMQRTRVGRILFRYMQRQAVRTIGAPDEHGVVEVAGEVVAQLTFRMLPTVSEGLLGRRGTMRLLRVVNLLSRRGRRARGRRTG
ncbi:MAG: glycosyl hydrolase [Herbiconiux sp.]|uniref:glycoside hydrolase family 3 C-terminal domain-containing protein n=1 Tax=Herbiconiux sp. TaxID=1871186 RepID=UPI0011FABE2D|nr:glycoside hydrolase family 3 C-terminal domain-containing protein [Herbiconiux sp.]TAJ46664.1 MAG: glycosyl hydrolase [Herbiconiux sp.]